MNPKILIAAVPVLGLWVAVYALTYLIFRELGWDKVKKRVLTLVVLFGVLVILPIAGVAGALWTVRGPIMYRLQGYWYKSPMIFMSKDCSIFPQDNIWNTRISGLPVATRSQAYIESIGKDEPLRGDWGPRAGIPYIVVDSSAPLTEVAFDEADES